MKWTPPGLYSALQPRRIVRLGVRTAGYLAASARLVVHTFPELPSPIARTRGAEPRGGETRWFPLMRWSTARCNVPDETPPMRGMQSAADPDRRTSRHTGRNLSTLVPTTTLFLFWREGLLLLATHLLIGRTRHTIPWPSPLDKPTVVGATPTLLGGVPIGGVCSSA